MCYNKTDVNPGAPCVTCITQRIVTDGLIHRGGHVTLYSRITMQFGELIIFFLYLNSQGRAKEGKGQGS